MAIHTTMLIHESTLTLIHDAGSFTGGKRSRIIATLLKRAMREKSQSFRTGSAIRYQERDAAKKWRTIHVHLREDEIDYFRDLRGILKKSVSLILAEAARAYIRDLVVKGNKGWKSDNYPFSNYVLSRETTEGLIFWKICWGFPEEPAKHFRR